MDRQTSVVVVGAGISGLAAAKLLHEKGVDVVVVEARDRVGGRTHTIQNDKVGYVDLGGAYIGPTQDHVLRLVEEFGLTLYRVYDEKDYIRFYEEKAARFQGAFPATWNPLVKIDLQNFLKTMDDYGSTIPLNAPWKAPNAKVWDKMSMKELYDKIIWTKSVRSFADSFVQLCVTSEPHEVSLLWFLWYVAQCGGTDRIYSVTNGGQECKLVGGTQQLSTRIADILGDRVHLNEPATLVEQSRNGATVHTAAGSSYRCDYVILALPPPMQAKLRFEPSLPSSRNQLVQRYPMGSVIKTITYYKRPFWRQEGMSGLAVIEDEGQPIGFTLDDTKPDGTRPAIMGFILANKAKRLSHISTEERRQAIVKEYAKLYQSDEALEPVHYEEKDWCAEQWSGGCYTGAMPPGFMTQFGEELRKPVGRLHFAGTECATKWSGYIDGGIQSGDRAAREILHRMGKLSADQVNVEPPKSKIMEGRPFPKSWTDSFLPSVSTFLFLTGSVAVAGSALALSRCPWFMKKVSEFLR